MASDSRKKPGRGFASTARASAVSRYIKKAIGVRTLNSNDRGVEGVRVHQNPYATEVHVRVYLDDQAEAAKWGDEIRASLLKTGYVLSGTDTGSSASFYVTRSEWVFADMVTRKMFAVPPEALETNDGLVAAKPHVIRKLRENDWIKIDTLELTAEGEQVRAYLLDQRRKRDQAERRRLRERGW